MSNPNPEKNAGKDSEDKTTGKPLTESEAGAPATRPREISREEMDRQQPADPDPDDPVSP
jgi:hypothetical protein